MNTLQAISGTIVTIFAGILLHKLIDIYLVARYEKENKTYVESEHFEVKEK